MLPTFFFGPRRDGGGAVGNRRPIGRETISSQQMCRRVLAKSGKLEKIHLARIGAISRRTEMQ